MFTTSLRRPRRAGLVASPVPGSAAAPPPRTPAPRRGAGRIAPLAPLAPEPLESRRLLSAAVNGFSFDSLATIGGAADKAPGGGAFVNDFEPYAVNNKGVFTFAADLSTGGEGIFVGTSGRINRVNATGSPAPGGGAFGAFGVLGFSNVNESGDMAFAFDRGRGANAPPVPLGVGFGVFRYRHDPAKLGNVLLPGAAVALPDQPAPGGGTFAGAAFDTRLNNRGDVAFAAVVNGADIDPNSSPGFNGLGAGVFEQTAAGQLSSVVRPGDAAPGGNVFDYAVHPSINDHGDVAFGAHLAGEENVDLGTPQSAEIFAGESIYLKRANGKIVSIAHQGQAAPGGGKYRIAFAPVLNNVGQILFNADLTPAPTPGKPAPAAGTNEGVFLSTNGVTQAIARPGRAMPGGGHMVTASFYPADYDLNDHGDVLFNATLDTHHTDAGQSVADTGMYLWSHGTLKLVARSGTSLPGVGTLSQFQALATRGLGSPHGGANLNDAGQVFFQATLSGGNREVLLLATPSAKA